MGARSLGCVYSVYAQNGGEVQLQEYSSCSLESVRVLYCTLHPNSFSSLGSGQSIDRYPSLVRPVGPIFVTPYAAVLETCITSLGRPVLLGNNMQHPTPWHDPFIIRLILPYSIPFYPNLHHILHGSKYGKNYFALLLLYYDSTTTIPLHTMNYSRLTSRLLVFFVAPGCDIKSIAATSNHPNSPLTPPLNPLDPPKPSEPSKARGCHLFPPSTNYPLTIHYHSPPSPSS